MPSAVNPSNSPDILVIGSGIVGLWTAYYAARQGASVKLLDKTAIGGGASGGLLGALMPHQPINWSDKKQFQLDGLLSLESEIADIENRTGLGAGYRRCGRLMPIRNAEKRRQSVQWADSAGTVWPQPYRWSVIDDYSSKDWLPETEMPHGANSDTLSARVDPRALVSALAAAVANMPSAELEIGREVAAIGADGTVSLSDGTAMDAGHAILTAGASSFDLLMPFSTAVAGRGVKGQAALLKPARPVDPALPILYDNGTYVVAHDSGLVAVGSTSENDFESAGMTDAKLDEVITKARTLCPALEGAEVTERWAGLRPRATGRDPLVGLVPSAKNLLVATGGFKISFAIAHLMAKAAVALADDREPDFLPDAFAPENRLTPRSA
ncbi:NAD(P)/FAD-dependent oxidoreductase [Oricola cellulosilytica]|uniref:FAD-binding oxidoreductase n=1 Tax=Oricola cellulosilytica TaxID=1429082 RepID=A0A4R0P8N5_9HYPH|nr:FAD-binding oxidoreductase [Oricola cellulosilytica]TCD12366.1 FAD-binding oxidoreductase [Oricola cellulosilytica]